MNCEIISNEVTTDRIPVDPSEAHENFEYAVVFNGVAQVVFSTHN
jgi:hypothetical protein